MRLRLILAVIVSLPASMALADLRPLERPAQVPRGAAEIVLSTGPMVPEQSVIVSSAQAPAASVRPIGRAGGTVTLPAGPSPEPAAAPVAIAPATAAPVVVQERNLGQRIAAVLSGSDLDAQGIRRSTRPSTRPKVVVRTAARAPATPRVATQGGGGGLCGSPTITGTAIAAVQGNGACGVADAVRITGVAGVRLSTPATVNCSVARALDTWVKNGAMPAVGNYGGGISSLRVVASYACRSRNSQRGARLSEHAKGNAIDIAGIGLAKGGELTLLTDWSDRREGAMLRAMHRSACGTFGTVLGPDANRFHRDHFHFDTARYRTPYCR
jgi:hypothetical protein